MDETMNKLSQWEKEVGEYEALEWELSLIHISKAF